MSHDHSIASEPMSARSSAEHRSDYYELSTEDVDRFTLHNAHTGLWQRVQFYLFARIISRAVKRILARGYESSEINSRAFHALNAIADRAISPHSRK